MFLGAAIILLILAGMTSEGGTLQAAVVLTLLGMVCVGIHFLITAIKKDA